MDLYKLQQRLGRDTTDEMDTMREEDLNRTIVEASGAMREVKEELEANPHYQKAKEDLSALSQGKKEVDKRQKAKIEYSLHLLERFGQMDPIARLDWEKERAKKVAAIEETRKAREEEKARQAKLNEQDAYESDEDPDLEDDADVNGEEYINESEGGALEGDEV